MDESIAVTRNIEVDLTPAELWELIADGNRWADWMVEEADVEVSPGAEGHIVDGGEHRDVHVDRVDDGERVTFCWWPMARPDQSSAVELRILPALDGTVLHVVETFPVPAPTAVSASARAWTARARHLGARYRAAVLAAT